MKITGKTRIIGIIGWPVKHSLSPIMHNAAFEHLGLDFCYVPFAVKEDHIEKAIKGIPALNISGLNVTIPHKESVIPFLSETSEEVKMIGAVNTIKIMDNKLIGYNTDGPGFIASLKEAGISIKNHSLLILGAGGAAKAVVFQSAIEGAREIIIANRTIQKAISIKNQTEKYLPSVNLKTTGIGYDELKDIIGRVDIIVNATSIGLKSGDPSPIPNELINKRLFVCDLIYNPPETSLIKYAKASGCKFMNGTGMLLHQGVIAFKIFTGSEAPIEVMRKSLEDALKNLNRGK